MGFAAITFLVIFLLMASGGLLLFYREAMMQRLSDVVAPRAKQGRLKSAIQQTGSSLGGAMGRLERILPRSQAETSVVQQRLIRAGLRSESAPKFLYGAKVLVPLTLCVLAMFSGAGSFNPFIVYAFALGLDISRRTSGWDAKLRSGRRRYAAACQTCWTCW